MITMLIQLKAQREGRGWKPCCVASYSLPWLFRFEVRDLGLGDVKGMLKATLFLTTKLNASLTPD
jgi:hypothetical protein